MKSHLRNISACLLTISLHACHNSDSSHNISGLDERPDNQTCIAPNSAGLLPSDILLEPAFPNLPNMGSIVALLQQPNDSNFWYAVKQSGEILRFANDTTVIQTEPFLDITSQISCCGERGLLGMAFHPDYANNGEVFLSYTDTAGHSRVSRFIFDTNQWLEENILTVNQPAGNHNGGNIAFGPDGFLYIGLGDGGGANDPYNDPLGHGQDTRTLLGSMLRIDVDNGAPYTIPQGNPFSGNALCNTPGTVVNENSCPEIYAWGLRNPWRWSFDTQSGTLWAGDVGQNHREEVDIIEAGNNYGWKITEGFSCRGTTTGCDTTGLTDPVAEYTHDQGCSITGGYVYRGSDPLLATTLGGKFLYADYCSGQLWSVQNTQNGYQAEELVNLNAEFGVSYIQSFAQGNNGDLFVLTPSANNIYKFLPNTNNVPPSPVADMLSATGCVDSEDPTRPAAGLIPYDIISPLWSDGAEKQRFIALPNNTTIDVTTSGDFEFPVGSVLMKNFYLNGKIVETRLLMFHAYGPAGYSYQWLYDNNGNPVDAQLLADFYQDPDTGWYYPSAGECLQCHTNSSKIALGPELQQLNKDYRYPGTGRTANQVNTLETIGLFSATLSDSHKNLKLFSLHDSAASPLQRVKSYLHSNCAHCHQPNEVATTTMDLRFQTALHAMNICDAPALRNDFGLANPRIIDPGGTYNDPNSVLLLRMQADTNSGLRMPPLATAVDDNDAIELIKNWIEELSACPTG